MKDKLRMVKIADIIVDARFRQDMGNIDELIESIKDKGIIQPITLSNDMHLLAGGRRYTACSILGLTEIPALLREITGEIDAREIELIENVHRKEFTWQEQAQLIARIHSLYQEKDPNWTGRATAQLIDQSPMNISRALKLARAIEAAPIIAECKTADDASKVLKKLEEDAIVEELAKRQQVFVEKAHAGHNVTNDQHRLAVMLQIAKENYIIGDVFDKMARLRNNGHIDLIECDPPYGIDLAAVAERTNILGEITRQRNESYQEIPQADYPEFIEKLSKETYRVAGTNCWMVFWFAFAWYEEVKTSLQKAGWHVDVIPSIWCKSTGRTPRPDILLSRTYEPFFLCRKGQPTVIHQGHKNIWMRDGEEKKYHPAQRPLNLLMDIIETLLDGSKTILVPFIGSGTTLRAAYLLGHKTFGFDSNPEYKNLFLLAVEEDTRKELAKQ